jgi:hypothetical protein
MMRRAIRITVILAMLVPAVSWQGLQAQLLPEQVMDELMKLYLERPSLMWTYTYNPETLTYRWDVGPTYPFHAGFALNWAYLKSNESHVSFLINEIRKAKLDELDLTLDLQLWSAAVDSHYLAYLISGDEEFLRQIKSFFDKLPEGAGGLPFFNYNPKRQTGTGNLKLNDLAHLLPVLAAVDKQKALRFVSTLIENAHNGLPANWYDPETGKPVDPTPDRPLIQPPCGPIIGPTEYADFMQGLVSAYHLTGDKQFIRYLEQIERVGRTRIFARGEMIPIDTKTLKRCGPWNEPRIWALEIIQVYEFMYSYTRDATYTATVSAIIPHAIRELWINEDWFYEVPGAPVKIWQQNSEAICAALYARLQGDTLLARARKNFDAAMRLAWNGFGFYAMDVQRPSRYDPRTNAHVWEWLLFTYLYDRAANIEIESLFGKSPSGVLLGGADAYARLKGNLAH